MFGWGTLTGWTNAASPQLRANASEARSLEPSPDQTGAGLKSGGETAEDISYSNGSGKTGPVDPAITGFGSGFGMDDEGSSWVGSSMAFGAVLGSAVAGIAIR